MLIPSMDICSGRVVQLVGGEELALEAGDPGPLLETFSVAGEVAVVDIDAARGEGDNRGLIAELAREFPIRIGGGIRDVETARWWLDNGARRIIIGTAANADLLRQLPSERVIVALDSRDDQVLSHGWRRETGRRLEKAIESMAGLAAGFLITFVELEGRLGGTDIERAERIVELAGEARVTIAGGITSAEEIRALDELGADAQVGMALYTGRLDLAEAITAPLRSDRTDGLWPTVVTDERGVALGLAWSDYESVRASIESRSGIYHSRTRGLWVKGETSGATQELLDIALDCDRDALRFRVKQRGSGFCHIGDRTCWGADRGLGRLSRRLAAFAAEMPEGSNTTRLLLDPELLAAKLREEANELGAATKVSDVAEEAADVFYFTLVKLAGAGVDLGLVEDALDRRERRMTRRPVSAKEKPT